MPLVALGLNHKTAPINLREKVTFVKDTLGQDLKRLLSYTKVAEAYILSTCNRTEIYSESEGIDTLLDWLSDRHQISQRSLKPYLYEHQGIEVVRHMMKVACGLDSMAIGEPQILGQMKEAFQVAKEAGAIGQRLRGLMTRVLMSTKKIRAQTGLHAHPISLAYTAVNLIKQIFSDLSNKTILLVGTGQTIELVAKYLKSYGASQFLIASRSIDQAMHLIKIYDGYAIHLSRLNSHLKDADIIVTASNGPLLNMAQMQDAMKHRKYKVVCIVDLGVPRNVEPCVQNLPDVYLYNVDDLKHVVQDGLEARRIAAKQAELYIEFEIMAYERWLMELKAVNTVRKFRDKMKNYQQDEIERALQQIQNGCEPRIVIKEYAERLSKKWLHQPTLNLRKLGLNGQTELLQATHQLFSLDD